MNLDAGFDATHWRAGHAPEDNHNQEPCKLPLPAFIEKLYFKRFGKTHPEVVMSIEERRRLEERKKTARREAKRLRREGVP